MTLVIPAALLETSLVVPARIKIDLQPKTKVVKIILGGNSKAFYVTKRFHFRFVSGARMYYFKFLFLRFKKNFLFEILF